LGVVFKGIRAGKANPPKHLEIAGEERRSPERAQRWVAAALVVVLTVVLGVAITLGVQDHRDRALAAQIKESELELRIAGARIAGIKDRDFQTMTDYIDAYGQIEPLQKDYDQKLQRYSDLCDRAKQRDQKRLTNIWRRHNRYNPEVWRNASEIIDLVRHKEFMPLLAQEHVLREKLLLAGQRISPEGQYSEAEAQCRSNTIVMVRRAHLLFRSKFVTSR
jgi:hypothetical protein